MKTWTYFSFASALLLVSGAINATPPNPPSVSLQSLLTEMTCREMAAYRSPLPYTLKQASSYDRLQKNPADPKGWHSNKDYGQFIRTEVNGGRKEWVLMEDTGSGAIVRFWTPLHPPLEKAIIRFYLDGASTPAIAVKFNDLFRGCGFVPPPFAFVSWNETDLQNQVKAPRKGANGVGGDLYLPISFAKGCKITLDMVPFFYVINYRMYAPGTKVETFTMDRYKAAEAEIKLASATLLASAASPAAGLSKAGTLAPGGELTMDMPQGAGAIKNLAVQIDPKDAPQVLRSTILQATFDDEAAIWCPLGEFFGAGARLNPVADWYRTAEKSGLLTSRWVMPYQKSARIVLKNAGTKPVVLKLAAAGDKWQWGEGSMYFHANWRHQSGIKTRPYSDWNYIEIEGQGVYVGDTLTVFSPSPAWYGEGDERIYVDGEKLSSMLGTGTEDYYGFAWGMPDFFNSPFISAPQRDSKRRENWLGYTTTSRVRLLDGIPFKSKLKLDMEIWDWADTEVDYSVGLFWYARPGAKCNRALQPEDAARALRETPTTPPAPAVKKSRKG